MVLKIVALAEDLWPFKQQTAKELKPHSIYNCKMRKSWQKMKLALKKIIDQRSEMRQSEGKSDGRMLRSVFRVSVSNFDCIDVKRLLF